MNHLDFISNYRMELPHPWPKGGAIAIASIAILLLAMAAGIRVFADSGARWSHQHCADGQVPKYDFVAVHYIESATAAVDTFKNQFGFADVSDMKVGGDHMGCNDARTAAVDAWSQCKADKWFFRGNYDATVGNNCQLYFFDGEAVGEEGCPVGKGVGGFAKGDCL